MSITLSNLVKRYADNLVVNNVSLKVNEGELLVLLGASGSGKTTILRMIAGLVQPDSGRIELNGRDVTRLPPQARSVGFVFQNYSVFRHMTVEQNVAFGLKIRRVSQEEQAQRVAALLELVGLTGFGSRYPDQLSGGQLQRVALARALAYQPAVLLLDEPFGALDVKIRAQLRQSLKEIQRQVKVTTILVTHDQDEAFELADRIGVIDYGILLETGSPEDLYYRPKTDFAASFVGGGNVLIGQLDSGQIRLGSASLPFPPGAPAHEEGSPVRILFRPETVCLQPQPFDAHSGAHTLGSGEVTHIIFNGSQQRITLKVEGLQGTRPLAPAQPFGRRNARILAVQPGAPGGDIQIGDHFWVGLRKYHILNPAGLKALICIKPGEDCQTSPLFCHSLLSAASDQGTILLVAGSEKEHQAAQSAAQDLRQEYHAATPHMKLNIRKGRPLEEITLETQEGQYDLLVMNRQKGHPGLLSWQALNHTAVPVLLLACDQPQIRRVLICTAGGEPGKADIRFGGRLARRVHATATLLTVRRPSATPEEMQRIERHFANGEASLEALGVPASYRIEARMPLVEGILAEAEGGNYDLIVMGAPPPPPHAAGWPNPVAQVLNGTSRPVLIVPNTL